MIELVRSWRASGAFLPSVTSDLLLCFSLFDSAVTVYQSSSYIGDYDKVTVCMTCTGMLSAEPVLLSSGCGNYSTMHVRVCVCVCC